MATRLWSDTGTGNYKLAIYWRGEEKRSCYQIINQASIDIGYLRLTVEQFHALLFGMKQVFEYEYE